MRISDWSSDVCSADLVQDLALAVWGPDDLLGPRAPGLSRALPWNPDNVLAGARHITLAGDYAYIAAATALVVVDLSTPLQRSEESRVRKELVSTCRSRWTQYHKTTKYDTIILI